MDFKNMYEYNFILRCSCQNTLLLLPELFSGNCRVCGIVEKILHSPKLWIGMHLMHRSLSDSNSPFKSNSSFKFLRLEAYWDDNGKRHLCGNPDGGSPRFPHTQLFNKHPTILGQNICLNLSTTGHIP